MLNSAGLQIPDILSKNDGLKFPNPSKSYPVQDHLEYLGYKYFVSDLLTLPPSQKLSGRQMDGEGCRCGSAGTWAFSPFKGLEGWESSAWYSSFVILLMEGIRLTS